MGYVQNGYEVHCVTSARYVPQIEKFCAENQLPYLHFYFANFILAKWALKIPLVGDYLHYYLWLLKARPKIKSLVKTVEFEHAHHITYSSIKFGTPLYNLPLKMFLGPLGGGSLPHRSLKKYLGGSYYFERFKFAMADFLAAVNPTVKSSVRSASTILVSNEIASSIVRRHTTQPLIRMFDAGLSENFNTPFINRKIEAQVNLLWIGRILPRKGLNLAIQTVSKLPSDFNFHLYVVGDGPLMNKAKEQVTSLGLQSKVTFVGKLPYDELKPIFEKSHLLLFPSLIDSCPMQVFESMAFGLPVVSLDHQGMHDQISEHTGIKVAVSDTQDYPVQLAKAVQELTGDPERYHRLSQNAYEFGQQQLWSKRIKDFISGI
jgi:glycosyltransferase involved in cell wall biosynthesis